MDEDAALKRAKFGKQSARRRRQEKAEQETVRTHQGRFLQNVCAIMATTDAGVFVQT